MKHIKQYINKIIINFKDRYVYLIIFFIAVIIFGMFSKKVSYIKNSGQESKLLLNTEIIEQKIELENKNVSELKLKVGNYNNNNSAYEINVFDGQNKVAYYNFNSVTIKNEDEIVIGIADGKVQNDFLKVQIIPKSVNDKSQVYLFTVNNVSADSYSINNEAQDLSLEYTVGYNKYTFTYNLSFTLIVLCGVVFILLFDVKKIHNCIFATIVIAGVFISILNPILDTPDDPAHICRSEFTSRGIFFITGDTEDYKISNSIGSIINDSFLLTNYNNFSNDKMDFSYDSNYENYANTNLFIGYIPQAIGIVVAKLFGKIFGLSSIFILVFGRLCNMIFYASIVRIAIKKAPIFKVPLSIVAMSPMALFIACSFNPDATTYALVLLLIGYILKLYKKENIDIKDIIIYTILCILIGLVKLPYCVIGGLIIFLPKSKFKDDKMYYKSFIFVAVIAVVCVSWGLYAMFNTSGTSPFNQFYIDNNIDVSRQINYIKNSPSLFVKNFIIALISNFKVYTEQLNVFGWLTYSMNQGAALMYTIFVAVVIILYPNEEIIARKIKYGIGIISVSIYACTCLILYLSWTPVGAVGIEGVQGRYFVPLIGLLMLLSCGRDKDNEKEKFDYTFLIFAMIFIVIFILTIINKYY